MKVCVKVEGKTFEVEIDSLHTQPIVARVDGEPVEVWLESGAGIRQRAEKQSTEKKPAFNATQNDIRAPIPGLITSIAVKPGDRVTYGQEICILDAMKMKNQIRSPKGGEIATVHISVGQIVKHNDKLVEFSPSDQVE